MLTRAARMTAVAKVNALMVAAIVLSGTLARTAQHSAVRTIAAASMSVSVLKQASVNASMATQDLIALRHHLALTTAVG